VPVFPQLGHLKFSTQWSRTIILQICACGCPVQAGFSSNGAEHDVRERIVLLKEIIMPQGNRDRSTAETGEQIPRRPHDSGSQANETVDGLEAATEALRHAAEDTPTGTGPGDVEKTPVFDRAGLAPKI
jgi:hypothetical protein